MNSKISFLAFALAFIGAGDARAVSVATEFVSFGATGQAFVPLDDALGQTWTATGFNDSSWLSGPSPFGFGYDPDPQLIQATNLAAQMRGTSPSAFVRFDFTVADPLAVESLALDIYIDDGFVAYLNGVPVASDNITAPLTWDSTSDFAAEANFNDPTSFDLTGSIGELVTGDNVLAIHGVNNAVGSSDFLVAPILSGTVNQVPEPQGLAFLALAGVLALRRARR